ncbi:hypothetical protein EYF80_032976 [Liparis tanakae]|uniref:Uncharacterized protein n=1 Tax=Liparis tanakae TaxID=230148 RepID=A0A4Z2GT02_9TELE|nr:hypothetical protein EYF80_032976 [Liparis tanakae]
MTHSLVGNLTETEACNRAPTTRLRGPVAGQILSDLFKSRSPAACQDLFVATARMLDHAHGQPVTVQVAVKRHREHDGHALGANPALHVEQVVGQQADGARGGVVVLGEGAHFSLGELKLANVYFLLYADPALVRNCPRAGPEDGGFKLTEHASASSRSNYPATKHIRGVALGDVHQLMPGCL